MGREEEEDAAQGDDLNQHTVPELVPELGFQKENSPKNEKEEKEEADEKEEEEESPNVMSASEEKQDDASSGEKKHQEEKVEESSGQESKEKEEEEEEGNGNEGNHEANNEGNDEANNEQEQQQEEKEEMSAEKKDVPQEEEEEEEAETAADSKQAVTSTKTEFKGRKFQGILNTLASKLSIETSDNVSKEKEEEEDEEELNNDEIENEKEDNDDDDNDTGVIEIQPDLKRRKKEKENSSSKSSIERLKELDNLTFSLNAVVEFCRRHDIPVEVNLMKSLLRKISGLEDGEKVRATDFFLCACQRLHKVACPGFTFECPFIGDFPRHLGRNEILRVLTADGADKCVDQYRTKQILNLPNTSRGSRSKVFYVTCQSYKIKEENGFVPRRMEDPIRHVLQPLTCPVVQLRGYAPLLEEPYRGSNIQKGVSLCPGDYLHVLECPIVYSNGLGTRDSYFLSIKRLSASSSNGNGNGNSDGADYGYVALESDISTLEDFPSQQQLHDQDRVRSRYGGN